MSETLRWSSFASRCGKLRSRRRHRRSFSTAYPSGQRRASLLYGAPGTRHDPYSVWHMDSAAVELLAEALSPRLGLLLPICRGGVSRQACRCLSHSDSTERFFQALLCDLHEQAPRACENFLALCASNYYDNVHFHRNIKGFMIQGGEATATASASVGVRAGHHRLPVAPHHACTFPVVLASLVPVPTISSLLPRLSVLPFHTLGPYAGSGCPLS